MDILHTSYKEKWQAFAKFIIMIADFDKAMNIHKENLWMDPNFSPYMAFELLKAKLNRSDSFCDATSLLEFMSMNGFKFDIHMWIRFVKLIGYQNEGFLNYDDFLAFWLPKNKPDLSREALSRLPYKWNIENLSFLIGSLILRFLELDEELSIEWNTLLSDPTFDIYQIFL